MATLHRSMTVALVALPLIGAAASAQEKSLYQRFGGYDAIAAVSDEFIGRLASDDQEKRFFIGFSGDSKMRIHQHIVDFICKAAGGPCYYTGRDMKTRMPAPASPRRTGTVR